MKIKKIAILFCLLNFLLYKNTNAQIHSSNAYDNIINNGSQLEHFNFLCSERAAGREAGTEGGTITANYISKEFLNYGLIPFNSKSYIQEFYLPNNNFEYYNEKKGKNVIGVIPAKKNNANFIIVCAHFDHIGIIKNKLYPGADDNASGVVALLELAKTFGEKYKDNDNCRYNIIFAAFDGNNYNLSGSKHFLDMFGDISKISCVINIDQIGNSFAPANKNKNYLLVLGAEELTLWQKKQLNFANNFFNINLDLDYTYHNSKDFYDIFFKLSDHYPFYLKNIPAILFTAGITKHTNKESDNIDNIDIKVFNKRVHLLYRYLWLLSN